VKSGNVLLISLTDDPARRWVHKMHTAERDLRDGER
jgi:hypothetical protein